MNSEPQTVTMNVSLPERLKGYVDGKVASGIYGSASEFVREAIREKLHREEEYRQAKDALEKKLLAGLDSGNPVPLDDQYIVRKKKAILERLKKKGA